MEKRTRNSAYQIYKEALEIAKKGEKNLTKEDYKNLRKLEKKLLKMNNSLCNALFVVNIPKANIKANKKKILNSIDVRAHYIYASEYLVPFLNQIKELEKRQDLAPEERNQLIKSKKETEAELKEFEDKILKSGHSCNVDMNFWFAFKIPGANLDEHIKIIHNMNNELEKYRNPDKSTTKSEEELLKERQKWDINDRQKLANIKLKEASFFMKEVRLNHENLKKTLDKYIKKYAKEPKTYEKYQKMLLVFEYYKYKASLGDYKKPICSAREFAKKVGEPTIKDFEEVLDWYKDELSLQEQNEQEKIQEAY